MADVVQLSAHWIMVVFAFTGGTTLFLAFILVINHAIKRSIP